MESFFAGIAGRWPAGRPDYHWHVLPDAEVAREHLARPYRELTHRPGLAPVRAEWLHVTVQNLGPVTAITGADLAEITMRVRDGCAGIAPFAVTAGRAEALETGVACSLRPGGELRRLWQLAAGAAREVTTATAGGQADDYWPHLALAYAGGVVDDGPVRAWISGCDIPEVTLPVTRLALVAQQHDGREITWRLIDEVPLGGGG